MLSSRPFERACPLRACMMDCTCTVSPPHAAYPKIVRPFPAGVPTRVRKNRRAIARSAHLHAPTRVNNPLNAVPSRFERNSLARFAPKIPFRSPCRSKTRRHLKCASTNSSRCPVPSRQIPLRSHFFGCIGYYLPTATGQSKPCHTTSPTKLPSHPRLPATGTVRSGPRPGRFALSIFILAAPAIGRGRVRRCFGMMTGST